MSDSSLREARPVPIYCDVVVSGNWFYGLGLKLGLRVTSVGCLGGMPVTDGENICRDWRYWGLGGSSAV